MALTPACFLFIHIAPVDATILKDESMSLHFAAVPFHYFVGLTLGAPALLLLWLLCSGSGRYSAETAACMQAKKAH